MSVNVLEDKKTIFHTVRNTYKKKKETLTVLRTVL